MNAIQVKEIRKQFDGCFELRFVKDVNQYKRVSAAQWADKFILMTKFISHDYEAIKKYKTIDYCNGAVSSLVTLLEEEYLKEGDQS